MREISIHEACRRGDLDAVRALITADPDSVDADDEHGWRPIFHAGLWRQESVVRLLVEHGADVNAKNDRGHTVLYCAGGHGHLDTVQMLLEVGVDGDAATSLLEWLAQYPGDNRFAPIAEALRQHNLATWQTAVL